MKNLFLDCGSNKGQGFEEFREMYSPKEYDFFLFEPNPNCFELLEKQYSELPYVKLHKVAVGVKEDLIKFRYRGTFDQGGSIVKEHNSGLSPTKKQIRKGITDTYVLVQVIDFLNYINEIKDSYNSIVMKLDIESAEYDLLKHFIDKDAFGLFDKMYIEFHSQYMNDADKDEYQQRERDIIEYLENAGVDFELWR